VKKPLPKGTPISPSRIRRWVDDFGGYRYQITEAGIDRWIKQFDGTHKDLAARLLDSVDYIGQTQMSKLFRDILGTIPGWHRDPKKRSGRWRFVAYSGSAGESGDSMLHLFRLANGLDSRKHNDMFVHRRDLLIERLTGDDTVVLIDDFSGTGRQVCNSWREIFQELLPAEPRVFLVLLGAAQSAVDKIQNETNLRPVCGFRLAESDNFFHSACIHFTDAEKGSILKYCRRADAANPQGYGGCGFVVVFAHRCPNNSIPILHSSHTGWMGLFPRHD
jgi:hypothetical protein